MANNEDLYRNLGFYLSGGGKQSQAQEVGGLLNAIGGIGNNYAQGVKTAFQANLLREQMKTAELENQQKAQDLTPIGQSLGIPSDVNIGQGISKMFTRNPASELSADPATLTPPQQSIQQFQRQYLTPSTGEASKEQQQSMDDLIAQKRAIYEKANNLPAGYSKLTPTQYKNIAAAQSATAGTGQKEAQTGKIEEDKVMIGALPDKALQKAKTLGYKDQDYVPTSVFNAMKQEALQTSKGMGFTLDPQTVDVLSDKYIANGQIEGLGMGGGLAKAQILSAAAKKLAASGKNAEALIENQAAYKAGTQELGQMQRTRGNINSFERTAKSNLQLALQLSKNVDRTGSPVINRWLNAGRKKIAGDAAVASFDAAVRVAINEVAKVTSGSSGGTVTTDAARKDIEDTLNSIQNPQQFESVANVLLSDMESRRIGFEEEIERGKNDLKSLVPAKPAKPGGKQSGTNPAQGETVPVGTIETGEGGARYRSKGGQRKDPNNWVKIP